MLPSRLRAAVAAAAPQLAGEPDLGVVAMRGREGATWMVMHRGRPRLFLKTAPTGTAADLRREHDALATAAASAVGDTVPAPLGVHEIDGQAVFAQTALAGRSLTTLLRGRRRTGRRHGAADIAAVASWVERLVGSDAVAPVASSGRRPADRLESVVAGAGADVARHPALAGLLASLADEPVDELVPVHGDLWPGNVVLDGRRLGVVDWQHARRGGPLDDLFFFLFTYAHAHPGGQWRWAAADEAFDRAFLDGGWISAVGAAAVHRRLRQSGATPGSAEARLLLFALDRRGAGGAPVGPAGTSWTALARRLLDHTGRTVLAHAQAPPSTSS